MPLKVIVNQFATVKNISKHMKNSILLVPLLAMLIFNACADNDALNMDKWKKEIIKTENDFAELAQKEGIYKAFLTYAADDAVIMRNNELISGKVAIDAYFKEHIPAKDEKLSWKPDHVSVSKSGDLGYTFGSYTFSYTDEAGETIERKGIFHTVWKKQADGTWKFVWD